MGFEDGDSYDDISKWSPDTVAEWFRENGYHDFQMLVKTPPGVNGARLLTLAEEDLQSPPFSMTDGSEIDHLLICIESLRKEQLRRCMQKLENQGVGNGVASNGHSGHINGYRHSYDANGSENHFVSVKMPLISGDNESSSFNSSESLLSQGVDHYPVEKIKTLVSLIYLFLGFIVAVGMLQVVHERVPSMEEDPPLPDIAFDLVPKRIEWAFDVCEINGMILVGLTVLMLFFHKHRFIVVRRIFFILGTLYIYRAMTMYVTTLPVPGLHFRCAPKVHGKISTMVYRAVMLLCGGGLSVTGSHHLCGDYLFSGHTVILVIMYMFIEEYTPRRFWLLHWVSWILAVTGIICILLAHDHYTIDIVVAYLIATRLFWTYHTMACTLSLKTSTKSNFLSGVWWFPIFKYFEGNVWGGGKLPRKYEWPLPWPRRLKHVTIRRSPIKGV
ncbi:phosphatidylcholine:ceramide cholinephosphotransferase 2-like [Styela clava]|uniref:phosphatidylcholine:ceramide cholinephosphotransferase 2-like n=1 Tax=Styela clava TaxID=7725 RepID=UPI00193AA08B|nr:phosphatidylcholine:ceramide cholinephosphotransferase 2-like [Styela clava]